jgi:probable rRNA maturation factor
MKMKEIKHNNIILHIADTGKSDELINNKKLMKMFKSAIEELSSHVWGKRKDQLRISRRKAEAFEISLTLCGATKIRTLNREYRNKDKKTDVLSFQLHEDLRASENQEFLFGRVVNLGDVLICKEVAKTQSKEFKISYELELIHLFIHGVLHLLGYDHEISNNEELIMNKIGDKLIKRVI